MSQTDSATATNRSKLRQLLEPYRDDLEAAVEATDDQDVADVHAVLAALARGEDPPADAAERVAELMGAPT